MKSLTDRNEILEKIHSYLSLFTVGKTNDLVSSICLVSIINQIFVFFTICQLGCIALLCRYQSTNKSTLEFLLNVFYGIQQIR